MILEVSGLSKNFNHTVALDNVSFEIRKSDIVGIVGPNGSGKTTLLNILAGTIRPTSGGYHFNNSQQIGMSISRKGFFDDMSVKNNLKLIARLNSIQEKEVIRVMNDFQIDFSDKSFGKLSAGMKQRVSLAVPFLKNQDLILLDEPSNHLDIDSIMILRSKILQSKEVGASFLITSHILSDLEKVCDRILFMKKGKIISNKSREELLIAYENLEDAYLKIAK
ncbi:MAG: ABC transporter ATP-binding protein [Cyclobacteriaceae bacterium]